MGAVNRLYRRARFFVRRVVNFDTERVLQFARQSAALTKAPLWWVVADMAWCSVRYETTFENYSEWDFRILRGRERKTYMTDPKSFHLSRRLNDNAQRAIFDDKLQFATRFGPELGREWIDLGETDAAAFAAFVGRHARIIAKNPGGVGGNGITLVDSSEIADPTAFREQLIADRQTLVEEVLVQHPDVAEAAVVGKPNNVLGETAHAFICLKPGAPLPDDPGVLATAELADYKRPESWTIGHDPLPRNSNGKILKKELRQLLIEEA